MTSKAELDLNRSIITAALTPNNKTGLTADQLDDEISAQMGDRLDLPPGCPSLEAYINRYFSDEFVGTPGPRGVKVYRLVPKADTEYLLKLVARQNDSGGKPMYVAQKARENAQAAAASARGGRASRGGRGTRGGRGGSATKLARPGSTTFARPAPVPARAIPSSRPMTSMDTSVSSFQKAFKGAVSDSRKAAAQPPPPQPTPTPPGTNGPAVNTGGWGTKFRDLFQQYSQYKEVGREMKINCFCLNNGYRSDLGEIDFPKNIEELYSAMSVFVNQAISLPKTAPTPTKVKVLPPVGKELEGTIVELKDFDNFVIRAQKSNGAQTDLPCSLYQVSVPNQAHALKYFESEFTKDVKLLVMGHKEGSIEVDIFSKTDGKSLVDIMAQKGVLAKIINFKNTAILPQEETFDVRVSSVMATSTIAVKYIFFNILFPFLLIFTII